MVIPTLNEAEAIGKLLEEVKACGYRKILVVDSTADIEQENFSVPASSNEVSQTKRIEIALSCPDKDANTVINQLESLLKSRGLWYLTTIYDIVGSASSK